MADQVFLSRTGFRPVVASSVKDGSITGSKLAGTLAIRTFGVSLTNGINPLTPGHVTATITVPFTGTITRWDLSADIAGSIVFDIKRLGTSIVGAGNTPTLSSQVSNSAAPSGWTSLAVTKGDIFTFDVNSVTLITSATLVVEVTEA